MARFLKHLPVNRSANPRFLCRQQQPVAGVLDQMPPVLTNRYCRLVSDQLPILSGSTGPEDDKLKRMLKNAHSRPLANARGSESASLSTGLVPSRDRQGAVPGLFQHPLKSAQLLATLEAMERWLNTGVRPDASFFPEDKGFDPKFVPPPWPY
jgi:hypothetical protein